MTDDEMRLEIVRVKGIITGTAQTHDFRNGYGPVRLISLPDGKDLPNWPGSIADAWELVEEMRAIDEIEVYIGLNNGENGVSVSVYHANWNGEDRTALTELAQDCDDTAPRAICAAWLQWRRGQS